MGDLNIDYLTMTKKECLDTVKVPYGFMVCNSPIPTRVTAQKSSLFGLRTTDSETEIDRDCTFASDTLVKSDNKAKLSILKSKLPNICKPMRKRTFVVKTTVRRYSVLWLKTVIALVFINIIVPRKCLLPQRIL